MKNFVLISFFALILTACKDPNIGAEDKTTSELLVAHGWQLDKYTDTQGTTISDGQLNSSARMLYGLAFEFKASQEVRGIDKTTKTVVNRGKWAIETDQTTLDIDIVGFEGDFEIVQINNTSMILNAKTGNNLLGVGPEVHLVFSEFKL
ncbi:hypothetical protein [Leadbetterella sp. DM7]|uniref:hypothetical protein n=1 Tax=Leadbetterella sp. DM7 TaxID=3235085 RepID=UPI00349E514F